MENKIIKYDNGAVRQSAEGKGTYKYIPTVGLKRLSHRYQYGEMKYGATDNFKKGLSTLDCCDSLMRHVVAYLDGDNREDHLAAVIWNALTIMEMEVKHPEVCDVETRKHISKHQCTPEYYRDKALKMFKEGSMK